MATTQYRVLGPIEIVTDAEPVPVPSRRQRALLAALIIANGRTLLKTHLTDIVWGDRPPANSEGAIHTLVSRLRGLLPAGALVTRSRGYVLHGAEHVTDATRFTAMVEQARRVRDHDRAAALELLSSGLGLWRGRAYEEFADHPFFIPQVERLHEMEVTASEDMFDLLGELGRETEAIPLLEQHVRNHPARTRPVHQLMSFLYAEGRQNDALETYARHRAFLVRELGIEPSEQLRMLENDILTQRLTHTHARRHQAAAAPVPVTTARLFGRDRELTQLERLSAGARLVTVLGPGGVGKSRLVAEYLGLTGRPDVVSHVVEVGKSQESGGVAAALSSVLGGGEWRSGADLGLMTLVFDDCEPALDEVREVIGLLLACNQFLRIVVTSRIRLGLVGERVLDLGPLPVPVRDDLATAAASPAVALLLDRMSAVRDIELSEKNVAPILAICRMVDGIPLGLETIAPEVRGIGIADLANRAAGQRHLGPVVDASYGLLNPVLQAVFRRLSVFRGAFTTSAMRVVCGMGQHSVAEVEQMALELVDNSMLRVVERRGETRYVLLDVLARRGAELLARDRETESTAERHASYFAALARERVLSPESGGSVDVTLDMFDDIGTAAMWCADHDDEPDRAFALVALLRSVHVVAVRDARIEPGPPHRTVGRYLADLADTIIARWPADAHHLRTEVATAAAAGHLVLGDFDEARERARQAVAAETLPGAKPAIHARQVLAWIEHLVDGDQAAAAGHVDEATALTCAVDDAALRCELALLGAAVKAASGEHDEAIRITTAVSREAGTLGHPHLLAWSRLQLGTLYLRTSPETARVVLELALPDARRVVCVHGVGAAVCALALVCVELGELGEAASLLRTTMLNHARDRERLQLRHAMAASIPVLVAGGETTTAANVLGALDRVGTPLHATPGAPLVEAAITAMTTTVDPASLAALRVRGSLLRQPELIREVTDGLNRVAQSIPPTGRYAGVAQVPARSGGATASS